MATYATFEKTPNALVIRMADGVTVEDIADMGILDIIEYQLCNGWEIIQPEECGALTDGLIITDDATRDDRGTLTKLGRVYWDADYQVNDAAETLRTTGQVRFAACE